MKVACDKCNKVIDADYVKRENCGDTRCANSAVAYNWDECIDSNFTKHWMPKEEARHE